MRVLETAPLDSSMVKKKGKQKKKVTVEDVDKEEAKTCSHIQKSTNYSSIKKRYRGPVAAKCEKCSGPSNGCDLQDDEYSGDGEEESSLWLCLQCGHMGCGRQTKHQHALAHYKTNHSDSHALALCLATRRVWCYECDDEVNVSCDKALAQCVESALKFVTSRSGRGDARAELTGRSGQVKAEKSDDAVKGVSVSDNSFTASGFTDQCSMETNLKQAKNHSTSQAQLNHTPKVKGLRNLGNTCFFNAVMQVLSHTSGLEKLLANYCKEGRSEILGRVLRHAEGHQQNGRVELPLIDLPLAPGGQMTHQLMYFLCSMKASSTGIINPSQLFAQVCKKAPRFKGFQQQDSHELLRQLMDGIKMEEVKRVKDAIMTHFEVKDGDSVRNLDEDKKLKIREYGRQAKHTFVDSIFGGYLISTVLCDECQTPSQIFEPFLDLSLPIVEEQVVKHKAGGGKEYGLNLDSMARDSDDRASKNQLKKQKEKTKKEKKQQNKQNKRKNRAQSTGAATQEDFSQEGEDNDEPMPNKTQVDEEDKEVSNLAKEVNELHTDANTPPAPDGDGVETSNKLSPTTMSEDENGVKCLSNGNEGDKDVSHLGKKMNELHIDTDTLSAPDGDGVETSDKLSPTTMSENENGVKCLSSGNAKEDIPSTMQPSSGDETQTASQENGDLESSLGTKRSCSDESIDSEQKLEQSVGLEASTVLTVNGSNHCPNNSVTSSSESMSQTSVSKEAKFDGNKSSLKRNNSANSNDNKMRNQRSVSRQNSNGSDYSRPARDGDGVDVECDPRLEAMKPLATEAQENVSGSSVIASLRQFTGKEVLRDANKFGCDVCTERMKPGVEDAEMVLTNASKQMMIYSPPAVLTLHIKRFIQIGYGLRKNNKIVEFPVELDLAPFCSSKCRGVNPGQVKVLYRLYGVVVHGGSLHGGHYTAYVKARPHSDLLTNFLQANGLGHDVTIDELEKEFEKISYTSTEPSREQECHGSWYHISDSHVESVSEERVLKCQAYLLFYERIC